MFTGGENAYPYDEVADAGAARARRAGRPTRRRAC